MNNWSEDSATSCDLIMIPQLRSPTQGLLVDENQNSTQNQVNSIPKIVEGNQFPSTSATPSHQGLTAWEKIVQQRHVKSLNRTRDNSKSNEDVGNEPINHKRYRQQSERDINLKSSMFRGVTKCKDSRFEAFVWDGKNRPGGKGKTVYIGAFKNEIDAAKAHDLIAIKIWGKSTLTNFPLSWYSKEISEMENMSETDCILAIRRAVKQDSKIKSNLGVSRKAKSKNWKARLDKGNGMPAKDLVTCTEEEAAIARDIVSIGWKEKDTITNFDPRSYKLDMIESATVQDDEVISSSSQNEQEEDNFLSQRRENEACHLNPSGENIAIFPYHGSNIKQSMFVGTSQESQAPQALQNQVENVSVFYQNQFLNQSPTLSQLHNYQNLEVQNNLSFQNDLSYPHCPSNFGTPIQGNIETLGNAFNQESSMHNMVNENLGPQNGVSSFGLNSTRSYTVEPYNQGFEAPNLGVLNQSYQPVQYGMNLQVMDQNLSFQNIQCFPNSFQNPCSGTNTGFQEGMVGNQSDLNISQIFNSSYVENQQTDVTDNVDNFWAQMQAHMLVSGHSSALGFQDNGM